MGVVRGAMMFASPPFQRWKQFFHWRSKSFYHSCSGTFVFLKESGGMVNGKRKKNHERKKKRTIDEIHTPLKFNMVHLKFQGPSKRRRCTDLGVPIMTSGEPTVPTLGVSPGSLGRGCSGGTKCCCAGTCRDEGNAHLK